MVRRLLDELRDAGFIVSTDGRELFVAGDPASMTDDMRRRIGSFKHELIALVADTLPARDDLLTVCRDAVTGTEVNPEQLCDWLLEIGDPGWCVPKAVFYWAEKIHRLGRFPT